MSVPVSLLRMLPPAASNPALPSLGWAQWAIDAAADEKPPTDEPDKWTKVVGRYRTRWIENGEKYCVSPPLTSGEQEYPDFPVAVLPPPSLMPIPDEVSYDGPKSAFAEERGPPQATEPPLYRSHSEFHNYHASWSQSSVEAVPQKSTETSKKE